MKRHLLLVTAACLALVATLSCKKEEETTTKPSLYGIDFDLPTFARPGDSFTLKPYGVYTGDGGELPKVITYKWKMNDGIYEEMDTFQFTIEEVGNHMIYCQASDPDGNYYAVSTSKMIIAIDPTLGKTLTGTGIEAEDDHITDERDIAGENDYFYTRIGDLEWFRNNLAYKGAGLAYENADVTSYPLGRFYTWDEAMTACPEGWRLPTSEEWDALGTDTAPILCEAYLNGKKMWEYWPNVPKTNDLQLAIIPSGYVLASTTTPSFKRIYDYAAFWTATTSEKDASLASYRYIYAEENNVKTTYGDKASLALSVRCVR